MKISSYKTYVDTNTRGFTLVEVLVSLSLFTIVVTMSVGTLLVLIDANGKQQNIQSVMTNLSFAMDSMTREIRTGYYYQCGGTLTKDDGAVTPRDCDTGNGDTAFAFTESGDSLTAGMGSGRIAYRHNPDPLVMAIERRLGDTGGWERITAPEVVIDTFRFFVTDTDPYPNLKSPTVTIFVSGTAGNIVGLDSSFNIQTTITQQILDL